MHKVSATYYAITITQLTAALQLMGTGVMRLSGLARRWRYRWEHGWYLVSAPFKTDPPKRYQGPSIS